MWDLEEGVWVIYHLFNDSMEKSNRIIYSENFLTESVNRGKNMTPIYTANFNDMLKVWMICSRIIIYGFENCYEWEKNRSMFFIGIIYLICLWFWCDAIIQSFQKFIISWFENQTDFSSF